MSVGTWTRFSTVPVRSLNRRPQSRHWKRRKPCTVRPSCSVVDDDWQCGQFMAALLIAQNRAREPIRWGRSRQAAPRSDRTQRTAAATIWRSSLASLDQAGPATWVTALADSKVTVAASNPNEGCQFVGRAFGERSSQMVEKGGNAGVQ